MRLFDDVVSVKKWNKAYIVQVHSWSITVGAKFHGTCNGSRLKYKLFLYSSKYIFFCEMQLCISRNPQHQSSSISRDGFEASSQLRVPRGGGQHRRTRTPQQPPLPHHGGTSPRWTPKKRPVKTSLPHHHHSAMGPAAIPKWTNIGEYRQRDVNVCNCQTNQSRVNGKVFQLEFHRVRSGASFF